MNVSDLYSGTALSGAGSGALAGGVLGSAIPGIGTAVGAIGGGLLGLFGGAESSSMRRDATAQQANSLDQIAASMAQMNQQNYQQHIDQLQKALAFYGPAQQYWDRLYGTGGGAKTTGQGSWSGTGVK